MERNKSFVCTEYVFTSNHGKWHQNQQLCSNYYCSVYFVSSVGSKLNSDSPAGVVSVMWWSVHQPAAAS